MLLDLLAQHIAVFRRRPRQERRGKASREFRLDADQALLGAGDFGGIAGQEVIHRLRRRELGDRRHYAERIGGQEDDVFRLPGAAATRSERHELERISGAGIFRQLVAIEVADARLRIEYDVFQHGAEPVGRRIDFRLGFGGQLDAFGVAAAFEIEDAVLAPAVLVVADQGAVRVGRQRCLACAREAKEQRDIAVLADIGRAMHRHHALRRQIEVQRGEDRFLHLAGIRRIADQDDFFGEIDGDYGVGAHAMALGIGFEAR